MTPAGIVRGDTPQETRALSATLERLRPAVLALLPDSELDDLEVWIQEHPSLYRTSHEAASDAEGLWAESHSRILLSRSADNLERTLAHELVHAALGATWRPLPGSLEEGLCDLISARISSKGAARLRAGRLSSAALACGGLKMELDIGRSARVAGPHRGGWLARIVLTGEEQEPDAHLDVFRVEAGLSSSNLTSGIKRGFYGLSFLVVARIVEAYGVDGLHEMCEVAASDGFSRVPQSWLLAAADLDRDQSTWRRAAAEAFGEAELVELLRMYSDFVVDALVGYIEDLESEEPAEELLAGLDAHLRLTEGQAEIDVAALDFIRQAVLTRLSYPLLDDAIADLFGQ